MFLSELGFPELVVSPGCQLEELQRLQAALAFRLREHLQEDRRVFRVVLPV